MENDIVIVQAIYTGGGFFVKYMQHFQSIKLTHSVQKIWKGKKKSKSPKF